MVDWRETAFQHYFVDNAAGGIAGFWECCCQAIFAYLGVEIIGIAADETERQRESLPRAVRRVSHRIIFYYVGAVLALGLNVSANDLLLKSYVSSSSYTSPFVLMVRRAGIPILDHIINAVALLATLSVANANLYTSVKPSLGVVNYRPEVCTHLPCLSRVRRQEYSKKHFAIEEVSTTSPLQLLRYLLPLHF